MITLWGIWIRQRIKQYDVIMTSNYVLRESPYEYIFLDNFGGLIIRSEKERKKKKGRSE